MRMRCGWLLLAILAACPGDDGDADTDGDTDTDTDTDADADEDCGNGEDDDGDGLVDCEDGDCADDCGEDCANGEDDDGDSLVDCDDDDCWGVAPCPETGMIVRVTGGSLSAASSAWDNRGWDCDANASYTSHRRTHTGQGSAYGFVRVLPQGVDKWSTATAATTCTWSVGEVRFSGYTWNSPSSAILLEAPVRRSSFTVQSGCGLETSGFLPQVLGMDEDGRVLAGDVLWYAGTAAPTVVGSSMWSNATTCGGSVDEVQQSTSVTMDWAIDVTGGDTFVYEPQ